MKYEEIITMVKEVSKLGLSSFDYSEGDMHISMNFPQRKSEIVPVQDYFEVKPSSDTERKEAEESGEWIKSPLVGTFYAAPSEESDPYVKKGDRVKKGQVLGIVEAMKLMNEIECEYDGILEEILVDNKMPVEYNQPLFRINTNIR